MTTYTDARIISEVRNATRATVDELPDDKILEFAGADGHNLYTEGLDLMGVIADAWIWLAGLDRYGAESNGNLAASQPQAGWRAGYYLSLSRRGGAAIATGLLQRNDLTSGAAASGTEFGT